MKRIAPGLVAVVLLAGCTADWDPDRPAIHSADAQAPSSLPEAPPVATSRPARSLASLPDRGELLAYDARTRPRRQGAYTSHPVSLSEAHAFAAAQPGGELAVAAPDGSMVRLGYERHVEHPDGDWTWIGRAADGSDAVLTFGSDAVYGNVPVAGGPDLRLTTEGGRTWMVETDAALAALAESRMRGHHDSDMLVPPEVVTRAAAAGANTGSPLAGLAGQVAANADETGAGTFVDIVVGFSSGLANQLGSDNAARTRVNHLMEVANQSLANSEIAPRLRLVRSMRVNYGDATSNESALEQLTGFSSSSQNWITVPAALRPLREARETYGGDLVVLLRAFRTPQNEGCGIAWIIGGDRSPYTVDSEPFGYSVVSDGQDRNEDDNLNYYCLDTSFAHEVGHNLGQTHSTADAEVPGVHAYSYGYRETSPSGFFTVMAYPMPDGNQNGILHFANPQVRYANRPTGVANASDNARSMRETMQVAAEFRATEVPLPGRRTRQDVNGDGRSDLLFWRNGTFVHWLMNGASQLQGRSFSSPAGWSVIGSGDFNGDGRNDVVWQAGNGNVYLWLNTNGNAYGGAQLVGNRAGWTLVGTRDVDGNGTADMQWFRPGTFVHWRMSGATVSVGRSFAVPANWSVIGTGDLNGDNRADVVLRAPGGGVHYWRNTNGNAYAPAQSIGNREGWQLRGVGDIDGDRRDDLVWWRSGTLVHWQMNGATVVRGRSFPVSTSMSVIGVGDFNGDGRGDILWWSTNGNIHMWLNSNGNAYGPARLVGNRTGWNSAPM